MEKIKSYIKVHFALTISGISRFCKKLPTCIISVIFLLLKPVFQNELSHLDLLHIPLCFCTESDISLCSNDPVQFQKVEHFTVEI